MASKRRGAIAAPASNEHIFYFLRPDDDDNINVTRARNVTRQ